LDLINARVLLRLDQRCNFLTERIEYLQRYQGHGRLFKSTLQNRAIQGNSRLASPAGIPYFEKSFFDLSQLSLPRVGFLDARRIEAWFFIFD